MDTRESSLIIQNLVTATIAAYGRNSINLGVVPTPVVSYLVKDNYPLGVVISASHNPYIYNGIKFFDRNGIKLSESIEQEIESEFFSYSLQKREYMCGKVFEKKELIDNYINNLKHNFSLSKNYSLIFDLANGATISTVPQMFQDWNSKFINTTPDGKNINQNCGSTNVEVLEGLMKNKKYKYGFSFDGDGDRVMVIDETGFIFNGDYLLAIFSLYLGEKKVVGTVMSNFGLEKFLEENNIEFLRAPVGDRFVFEMMDKYSINVGGEQSGHIILKKYSNTGDGLITTLMFLKVAQEAPEIIQEVKEKIKIYPQFLLNLDVKPDVKFKILKDIEVNNYIKKIQNDLKGKGRILVRASGTEHKLRIMTEGENADYIYSIAKKVANFIKEKYEL